MSENALYYALSTIAQCAAALAALIGFFALWRLDRLREQTEDFNRRHGPIAETNLAEYEHYKRTVEALQGEQHRLLDSLVAFLLGTLVVLIGAIVLIPFSEALSTWINTMRVLIALASLWLGGAPAYVVLRAANRTTMVDQRWSHLTGQIRGLWRRGPVLVVEWLRGQWRSLRAWRLVGAQIRSRRRSR